MSPSIDPHPYLPYTLGTLLLSMGFGLALYCFPRASASHFTAFHGLGPRTLLLSTGFGLALYCFPRASAWRFTAFRGLRPRTLQLSAGFGPSPTTSHPPNPNQATIL
ncbi:hypothetical protein CRG98_019200 [Punica granatum]|uniref:Uncharacterized protein n=1 Tax=Punica granatum TaxID=22663 RepID=A0A2I0JVW0_PUNGR|nr:hypothetical protein CRG98_019200 [Punica granatum]